MNTVAFFWSALAPFMILLWLFQRVAGVAGRGGLLLAAVLAAAVTFFPWYGHPLPYWTASLSANFSVPMILLLVAAVLGCARGRSLLAARAWRAAWIFGAAASVLLYPSAFGFGPQTFDLYALGWPWLFPEQSLVLFGAVAGTAAWLVWRGNSFGYFIVAALVGYSFGWQESSNVWDYLLDPVFGAVSLVVVIGMLVTRGRWLAD